MIGGNNSAQCAGVNGTTQAASDTTPPTVPTGLTTTPVSSSQINLSWNASTDPDSAVSGYKVYRNGTQIGTSSSTTYSDTGLSPSTTYTYTVSLVVTDKDGADSVAATRTLTVLNVAPIAIVSSPCPGIPGSERKIPRAMIANPNKFLPTTRSQRHTGWRSIHRSRPSTK